MRPFDHEQRSGGENKSDREYRALTLLENGTIYEGEWLGGLLDGRGIMIF